MLSEASKLVRGTGKACQHFLFSCNKAHRQQRDLEILLFLLRKHFILVRVMVDPKPILGTLDTRKEYTLNGT